MFSEWLNVVVRASWAYSEWMPVIALAGQKFGLSPLLQWIVVPAAAFAFSATSSWTARSLFTVVMAGAVYFPRPTHRGTRCSESAPFRRLRARHSLEANGNMTEPRAM